MMRSLITLALVVMLVTPAFAADDSVQLDDAFGLDLPIPESPAFDVLDLTPETVIRPASPKEFATSLLNGVDRQGHFQSGIALDTVPYLLSPLSNNVTLEKYQANPNGFNAYRLMTRIGLSIATVKGTESDDEAWRAAVGLNIVPYDAGDPRMDFELQSELRAIERKALRALSPADSSVTDAIIDLPDDVADEVLGALKPIAEKPTTPEEWKTYEEAVEKARDELRDIADAHATDREQVLKVSEALQGQDDAYKRELTAYQADATAARERAKKRNWKKPSWHIGAAPRWISDNGTVDKLHTDGGAFWTSLALGTEDGPRPDTDPLTWAWHSSQLIFHLRGRIDADVPDPDDEEKLRSQDDVLAGLRLRIGLPRLAFNFSGAYLHVDPKDGETQDLARYSVGVNIQIIDNWWIELVGGGQTGGSDEEDQTFVLSSVKFAMPEGRSLAIPGL